MTIQQLQYILEVQRTGSISQAAKLFLVSQACVSNAVRALEEELGFAVFTRGWRGVVPTERGLEVLKNARQVCEYHDRILKTKEPTARERRIFCHTCQSFFDAFSLLVQENADRKDLSFACIHQSSTAVAMEKLVSFDVDLFMACPIARRAEKYCEQAAALGLEVTVRGSVPIVAKIGRGHPLYAKPELTFEDLREETYIGREQVGAQYPTGLWNRLGFTPKRIITVSSQSTRVELRDKGIGFAIGMKNTRQTERRSGIRSVPIPGADPYQVLSVTNPQRTLPHEIERYLQLLDALLEEVYLPPKA